MDLAVAWVSLAPRLWFLLEMLLMGHRTGPVENQLHLLLGTSHSASYSTAEIVQDHQGHARHWEAACQVNMRLNLSVLFPL